MYQLRMYVHIKISTLPSINVPNQIPSMTKIKKDHSLSYVCHVFTFCLSRVLRTLPHSRAPVPGGFLGPVSPSSSREQLLVN